MAKFSSTTFGPISGRHGTAVAATTKDGKSYIRVYRAPSNPKTEKQVAHRSKFAYANKALSCLGSLFKETFNSSRGKSLGVSYALKNAIIGEAPDFSVDFSNLVFTIGNVNQAINPVLTIDELNANLSWDFVAATNSKSQDCLNLIFFNEETQLSIHMKNVAQRGEKSTTCILPEVWKGSTVYCWIYFSACSGDVALNSTSQFVNSFEF